MPFYLRILGAFSFPSESSPAANTANCRKPKYPPLSPNADGILSPAKPLASALFHIFPPLPRNVLRSASLFSFSYSRQLLSPFQHLGRANSFVFGDLAPVHIFLDRPDSFTSLRAGGAVIFKPLSPQHPRDLHHLN